MSLLPEPNLDLAQRIQHVTGFSSALSLSLASLGTPIDVPAAAAIFVESTTADSAYVILHGSVDVHKRREFITTLGPGAVFGEIALVDSQLRNASVAARRPTTLLRLEKTAFQSILESDPDFTDILGAMIASRTGWR